MPKKRSTEAPGDREKRLAENAQRDRGREDAADKAIDEMVKRSIRNHGA